MTVVPESRDRAQKGCAGNAARRTVDEHVGGRLRLRRTMLRMSQAELGRRVGLTFQQIQKYENGINAIGPRRLWAFAELLDVPVSFFFDDLPRPGERPIPSPGPSVPMPLLGRQETLELVECYYRVEDPSLRRRVFDLLRATVGAMENAVRPPPASDPP